MIGVQLHDLFLLKKGVSDATCTLHFPGSRPQFVLIIYFSVFLAEQTHK